MLEAYTESDAYLQEGCAEFLPSALFGSSTAEYSEAVRFPRNQLDQRFAVLLMRSVYEAVDALDFIPMVRLYSQGESLPYESDLGPYFAARPEDAALQSEFQAKFWKLRQSEYERYLHQYSPLRVRQVEHR